MPPSSPQAVSLRAGSSGKCCHIERRGRLSPTSCSDLRHEIPSEELDLNSRLPSAVGRILRQEIFADRSYPPFDRAMRDGYAVRSVDLGEVPRTLRMIGECRAGTAFDGEVAMGLCVQIMTGAPIPAWRRRCGDVGIHRARTSVHG